MSLRRSARPRIVNVSSGTGSLGWSTGPNPQFAYETGGSGAAYRSSKAALNALTVYYAQALAAEGFKVNALAPGLRATDLNARAAAIQRRRPPVPCGWRSCKTTGRLGSSFHGTTPPCHGELRHSLPKGQPSAMRHWKRHLPEASTHSPTRCSRPKASTRATANACMRKCTRKFSDGSGDG
jgi:Enoyl-(Acyl carrier protein) reductase